LSEAPRRVVALGASNLTRGLQAVVATARGRWGRDVEILAALGLGRSYGLQSRVLLRTLPGILHSGLWTELKRRPPVATRAVVTDVGNDILYGAKPAQILAWVDECLSRLSEHTADITVTGLPVHSLKRLSTAKFLFFRSLLFPRCRLSQREVLEAVEDVAEGLARLAEARRLRFLRLDPEWYGFDPIHFRLGRWYTAWQQILEVEAAPGTRERVAVLETARLYSLFPEEQWLLGLAQRRPQTGRPLKHGGRIWLY
jgi:hypothetical protein